MHLLQLLNLISKILWPRIRPLRLQILVLACLEEKTNASQKGQAPRCHKKNGSVYNKLNNWAHHWRSRRRRHLLFRHGRPQFGSQATVPLFFQLYKHHLNQHLSHPGPPAHHNSRCGKQSPTRIPQDRKISALHLQLLRTVRNLRQPDRPQTRGECRCRRIRSRHRGLSATSHSHSTIQHRPARTSV